MKKLLIVLWLIIPFHSSQALSLSGIVDWVKPLMPWYEEQPELTFELTDTKGNVFTEKNTRGKYLVVNFWATWCAPCVREIPAFVKFYNENSEHVELLGLNYEPENLEGINDFVERFSINYPVVLFDENTDLEYQKFGEIVGMPTTLVYSPKGELLQTFIGEVTIEDLNRFIVPSP